MRQKDAGDILLDIVKIAAIVVLGYIVIKGLLQALAAS